jgi:hypothetical protein
MSTAYFRKNEKYGIVLRDQEVIYDFQAQTQNYPSAL